MVINRNGKALFYIGTNDAIKVVYDYIVSEFPFLTPHIGIYTSMTKVDKETQLYKKIILSTTKSCGAASDIYDLQMVINLAEPFRSSVLAQQTLGRCRMNNTLYLDIVDQGFYFTKSYYESKKSVFSQYAKSCKCVMFSDAELEDRCNMIREKYGINKVMCMRVYVK